MKNFRIGRTALGFLFGMIILAMPVNAEAAGHPALNITGGVEGVDYEWSQIYIDPNGEDMEYLDALSEVDECLRIKTDYSFKC